MENNPDSAGIDFAEIRAEMSPIGQEALDAAVARLMLKRAQARIGELERQRSASVGNDRNG